jgi:hypothetical protein
MSSSLLGTLISEGVCAHCINYNYWFHLVSWFRKANVSRKMSAEDSSIDFDWNGRQSKQFFRDAAVSKLSWRLDKQREEISLLTCLLGFAGFGKLGDSREARALNLCLSTLKWQQRPGSRR